MLPKRPLLAGEKGVRLSLAGAQDKIAVRLDTDGKIYLPLNYAPSTHILKPGIATWAGIVSNEMYCMALAQTAGL
ncbi:MAG: HipA domain-containing protein [Pseudomonadales bacterium]|nr:HipA domain-containing protein [Pseudomonadales bacterium]